MGMMNGKVLVSYDIEKNHNDVKEELQRLGYKDYLEDNVGIKYDLPNTTLIKNNTSTLASKMEVEKVCRNLNANLTKIICVIFGNAVAK